MCHNSVGDPRGRIKSLKPNRISNLVIPIFMWNVIQYLLPYVSLPLKTESIMFILCGDFEGRLANFI